MACFDNIIGLSRIDCECFEPQPEDYNTSLSGLFLDELESLDLADSLKDCDEDVWDILTTAREAGTNSFQSDLKALLLKRYKLRRSPYVGVVGRQVYTSNRDISGYAGVKIYCANIKSGTMKIRNIKTLFNETGTIIVYVKNNIGDTLATLELLTLAGKLKDNVVNITLPMYDEYRERVEYFIYYEVSNLPKNNDLKCDCGSFKPFYNPEKPYISEKVDARYLWAKWVMVGGFNVSVLPADWYSTGSGTNYMNGLILDVSFNCAIDDVICKDAFNFESNPLASLAAKAILYKSGWYVLHQVRNSTKINREALLNGEIRKENLDFYSEEYNKLLGYIAENTYLTDTDCWICDPRMKRTGIVL